MDGNYSIEGSSVLQMRCPGELLQVAGDFSMASSLSHSNMLNNGRFELGGNFNQSGDSASFGSNGNFVIAFTGDGTQRVHFENKDYSQFAHVDPAYADYQEDETGLVVTARITYNICCGIIEGFQEMFTMPELSDTAEKILLVLGVSIAAGVLLAPEVVIPILQTCATLILFFLSAFTVVQAGSNIYSTATGNGDKYEKARKFGKDGIILLVSVIAFKGAVGSLVQDAKFVKNLLVELKTRKISELCGNTNLVKVLTINSASDAQLIVKTCLDETALTCFNQQTGSYSLAQLKNITEVVTTVYERTGMKLTAAEVSKGIEELGETDEVGTAVENVVRYHNFGGNYFSYRMLNSFSADDINAIFKETMGYEPPYKSGTSVIEIQLNEDAKFVRVYDKINSRMQGGWVMKAEDVMTLTPQEIQNKFALPNTPIYMCDVELESGTILRMGEVNPLFGFDGGGQQYDLFANKKNVGIFSHERRIEQ